MGRQVAAGNTARGRSTSGGFARQGSSGRRLMSAERHGRGPLRRARPAGAPKARASKTHRRVGGRETRFARSRQLGDEAVHEGYGGHMGHATVEIAVMLPTPIARCSSSTPRHVAARSINPAGWNGINVHAGVEYGAGQGRGRLIRRLRRIRWCHWVGAVEVGISLAQPVWVLFTRATVQGPMRRVDPDLKSGLGDGLRTHLQSFGRPEDRRATGLLWLASVAGPSRVVRR